MLTTSARMTLRLFRSTLCFAVFELRLLYTCGTRVEIVRDIIHSCAQRHEDPYSTVGQASQERLWEVSGTMYTTLQLQQVSKQHTP